MDNTLQDDQNVNASEGTQTDDYQPSQVDDANGTTIQNQDTSSDNLNEETPNERNLGAEVGKISALEKKNNEYQKQLEELSIANKLVEDINTLFAGAPDLYENFRQRYQQNYGVDLGSYEQLYAQQQAGQMNNAYHQQPAQESLTPEQVKSMVSQTVRDLQGYNKFIEKFPEMNPNQVQDYTQREKLKGMWEDISTVASALMARRPELDPAEALTIAYEGLPENRNKSINKTIEKGKAMGMQDKMAYNSATSGTVSGSGNQALSPDSVRLNDYQRRRYNEMRQKSPTVAQKYLEQIQKSRQ